MKIAIYSQNGKEIKQINCIEANNKLSDQVLVNYINFIRSSIRNPIADSLNRGQVSGGGKKPWKQ